MNRRMARWTPDWMADGEAMLLNSVIFYFFALFAVVSAILTVTRRNVVHSAVFLIATLVATAGIYLQLQAEFLFAVQLILFASAIMMMFFFVIMLLDLDLALRLARFNRRRVVALALGVTLFAEIGFALFAPRASLPLSASAHMPAANTEALSTRLFSHYVLPLELTSILLLVAMVGAVLLARRRAG
jgi:NADH-quinone oxidoreductase subunit J